MFTPTQSSLTFRPRLVLAYADSAYAALCCRHLRRMGWEVHLTSSGCEARRLAQSLVAQIVVLDIDLPEESGWLTCAKLTLEQPGLKVVLVGGEVTTENVRFARHVGASALVPRSDGTAALVEEVNGSVLSSAG